MRYFYDTEFIEDGRTIDLISIGIVCEDGRTYYAVSEDHNPSRAGQWVKDNVLAKLPPRSDESWRSRMEIADDVRRFIGKGAEMWADYGAYDHVVLCQLWGTMMDLPGHVPMFTHEFRQAWEEAGCPELPPEPGDAHDALADAQHLAACFRLLVRE